MLVQVLGLCLFAVVHSADLGDLSEEKMRFRTPDFVDLQRIADFEVRPTDVFVVSWPKSGATWVQQLVHQIMTRGAEEEVEINELVPYLEATDMDVEDRPSPRVFKTHMPVSRLPFFAAEGAKYIYIMREPKHLCSAIFRYVRDYTDLFDEIEIDTVVELFGLGYLFYGSWYDHVLGWWAVKEQPNVLLLKFEDLLSDLDRQTKRIAHFLDTPLSPTEHTAVLRHAHFDYMHAHAQRFGGHEWATKVMGESLDIKGIMQHVRPPVTSALPSADIQRLKQDFRQHMTPVFGPRVLRYKHVQVDAVTEHTKTEL